MEGIPKGFDGGDDPIDGGRPVRPLPWASRLSAMPYLPGGGPNQIAILRELLQALLANDGLLTATVTDGTGQERSLRDALKQLSTAGFVQKLDRDHAAVTAEALSWLESNSDAALLAIFHRHVRYVGELLHALQDGPLSVRDLMEVARDRYDLAWTTLDQTRRRVTWLSCMRAVEYRSSTLLAITQQGEALAKGLEIDGPRIAAECSDTRQPVDIAEPPPAIAGLLGALTPEALAARNPVLGYVPRGKGEATVVDALQALVNAASPSSTKAELLAFAAQRFGVSESSFGAVLTTLTRSGLIVQTSLNDYEPTAPARAWLETADPLDLALVVHARYLFVLEIIPMLRECDRAPDLARAAVDFYGLPRPDAGGVRTRLQILKAAGLIVERANWRYQATPLGEEVVARVPLQTPADEPGSEGRREPASTGGFDQPGPMHVAWEICRELVSAGTDSDNPVRLERAAANAFEFLGFEARHIGGGGKTDVLATTNNSDLKPVRVIVDAKSARSGTVNEGAVSFDTLREHQAQHRADHVVLVGPSFDTGRVRKRAEQNHVALLTTDELAGALARHARTPLSTHHYLGLVSLRDEDRREVESRWSATDRRTNLLAQIVTVLAEEARDTDDVTHGALTSDQIYLIAREGSTGARPHPKDIEAVLGLLQHPLVNAVRHIQADRGRPPAFQLIDDPALVQAKLLTLARSLDGLGETIEVD
ncbi:MULTISPECIES: restriction endonuclease [Nocardioides]|uniref:Restriction endonuclease n=1 Tax=Nocardioides vastitatis TaxID=2568655 RepID=A0ABW0ZK52_9ACTN|nr:restriction endonuclease [Nocardioides sp.]THJ05781.1 hypothetical protein E7Z54_06900 [Nocardioides sp.]